ncbi:MAG TPA: hypothetical protein P5564_07140, partial [Paludibacteraceae bacterium]|nr:hypothetical protein [Paludibacteraceae bacterium]
MKKLQFIFAAAALLVLSLGMTGCDPNDPNNPDNPATSEIVSTFEIYNEIFDNLVVEAIYKNDTRMYFVLLNADSCFVTSYYFYYGSSNFVRYAYGSNLVIPETLTHKGVTYNVIGAGALDYGGAGDKVTSIWINTNMEKLNGGPTQFPLLTSINVTTD